MGVAEGLDPPGGGGEGGRTEWASNSNMGLS
jgi:hypothetical protein